MSETGAALPSQRYAAGVARGDWLDDPAQHAALRELDRIHAAVAGSSANGFLGRLLGRDPAPPRGLYLWGGVGRGKTFLVDLFHDGLPTSDKRRTHFHRFMRSVHDSLREHAGERDPLAAVHGAERELDRSEGAERQQLLMGSVDLVRRGDFERHVMHTGGVRAVSRCAARVSKRAMIVSPCSLPFSTVASAGAR